jgi:hypothetical protein
MNNVCLIHPSDSKSSSIQDNVKKQRAGSRWISFRRKCGPAFKTTGTTQKSNQEANKNSRSFKKMPALNHHHTHLFPTQHVCMTGPALRSFSLALPNDQKAFIPDISSPNQSNPKQGGQSNEAYSIAWMQVSQE